MSIKNIRSLGFAKGVLHKGKDIDKVLDIIKAALNELNVSYDDTCCLTVPPGGGGGDDSQMFFADSTCIQILGTGDEDNPITAYPIISEDPDNVLVCNEDGLFVAAIDVGGGITADNGLTMSTATNVQLGGTLIVNPTTIDVDGSNLVITGNNTFGEGAVLQVNATGAGVTSAIEANTIDGYAMQATASGTGAGIKAQSVGAGGIAVFAQTYGVGGTAVYAQSQEGKAGEFLLQPASVNTVLPIITLSRNTIGVPTDGIGGSLDFITQDTVGGNISNQIISKLTNATGATATSQFEIWGVNNGGAIANLVSITGSNIVGIGVPSPALPLGTRLQVAHNALGAQSMVYLSSTSTAAASNIQKMLDISLSGANATASQTTYGEYISNTHTGTTPQNVGLYAEAVGGTVTSRGVWGAATVGAGIYGTGPFGVVGISSTGTAVYASATGAATGLHVESATGLTGQFLASPATNSTVVGVLEVGRQTTNGANGADGIGAAVNFGLETDSGTYIQSNQIISTLTTAAAATRTSELSFTGVDSATTKVLLTISGAGIFVLTQGLSNFANDAAAAGGGIPVNGLYRNGSVTMIRVS